jgi:hypothetical protein
VNVPALDPTLSQSSATEQEHDHPGEMPDHPDPAEPTGETTDPFIT